jgi:hypothetical protein
MGGGFSHGSVASGYHGGSIGSAYRGGYASGVGRGYGYGYGGRGYGRGYGYGYRGGYWPYYGWGYPWFGFGYSYWPSYYGYYNGYPYDYYSPDTYSDPGYAYTPGPSMAYAPAQADPYPQAAPAGAYAGAAHPVTRSYDQYGQEVNTGGGASNSSPIYLFALKDGAIQAAASYSITGQTLHYVTMDHQEKEVALGSIDRALTQQLNHERRVPLTLPQQ